MSHQNGIKTDFSQCTELVIVCCHATFASNGNIHNEDNWILKDFERGDAKAHKPSKTGTFTSHVSAGVALCENRMDSTLLIFSGGRTTDSDRSEADGYYEVLRGLFHPQPIPSSLIIAKEEYATDSYQNLLFSILKFQKLVGRYPEDITLITHAFKERRFLELHAPAIKWPSSKLRVQGINPPFTLEELENTQKLEHEHAYDLFIKDSYGGRPPLSDKRKARNWKAGVVQELVDDERVRELLAWDGGESGKDVFTGKLPWEG